MSIQLHAPATDEEIVEHALTGRGKPPVDPSTVRVWTEADGWCSACRCEPRRVVHMGTEERNFALCGLCLARLADSLRSGSADHE